MAEDLRKSRQMVGGYEKNEHTQSKQPKKSKQMVAVDYVLDNYEGSLRFDDVAMKAQIFQLQDINNNKGHWKYVDNKPLLLGSNGSL